MAQTSTQSNSGTTESKPEAKRYPIGEMVELREKIVIGLLRMPDETLKLLFGQYRQGDPDTVIATPAHDILTGKTEVFRVNVHQGGNSNVIYIGERVGLRSKQFLKETGSKRVERVGAGDMLVETRFRIRIILEEDIPVLEVTEIPL